MRLQNGSHNPRRGGGALVEAGFYLLIPLHLQHLPIPLTRSRLVHHLDQFIHDGLEASFLGLERQDPEPELVQFREEIFDGLFVFCRTQGRVALHQVCGDGGAVDEAEIDGWGEHCRDLEWDLVNEMSF